MFNFFLAYLKSDAKVVCKSQSKCNLSNSVLNFFCYFLQKYFLDLNSFSTKELEHKPLF